MARSDASLPAHSEEALLPALHHPRRLVIISTFSFYYYFVAHRLLAPRSKIKAREERERQDIISKSLEEPDEYNYPGD